MLLCEAQVVLGTFLCLLFVSACHARGCRLVNDHYMINKERLALPLGCYHSAGNAGVFPSTGTVNLRSEIDWDLWVRVGHAGDIIKKCGELALKKDVYNFGVEFYGECYFGNTPDLSQGRVSTSDGCDQHCKWDVGGPDTMVIYNLAFIDG